MSQYRHYLVILSIATVFSVWSSVYADFLNIQEISVRGNTLFPDSTILLQIDSKVGLPYDPEIITKDIQKIYDIGFFSSIQVEATIIDEGMHVTFVLEKEPLISSIEFKGNKVFKDEQLEEALILCSSDLSDILNLKFYHLKIKADLENIKQLYYEAGFGSTQVLSKLLPDPSDPQQKLILQYSIEEGEKTTSEVQHVLSIILPTVRQKEELTLEEFKILEQFLFASQKGDTQRIARFVQENRQYAQTMAKVLNDKGKENYGTSDYKKALTLFGISLSLYQQLGDLANEGAVLHNIGGIYSIMGEYQQALNYYQKSLTVVKAVGGPMGGMALNRIGEVYHATGEYQRALEHFQESLMIFRSIHYQMGEGTSLNNIGAIYQELGEYQHALASFLEALAIFRATSYYAGEGTTLHNIGGIYQATGEYQHALASYQEALIISKKIDDRIGEGITLHSIGGIYQATGEYRYALDFFQEALTIFEAIGYRVGEGTALNSIGGICEATGEYQRALGFFQEALTIFKAIGYPQAMGMALHNIGGIYHAIGEYRQALDYYQEALTIHSKIDNRAGEAAILHNIGGIYQEQGAYRQALDFYQDVLSIRRALGDPTGEGTTLNNIGGIYAALEERQQAIDSYQEALTICKTIGDREGEGITLHNISMLYEAIGEYRPALDSLQEALIIFKEIGYQAGEQKTLNSIGYVHEQQAQWRKAVEFYQQAIALLESIRSKVGSNEARESFLGQERNVYAHTVKLLLRLNSPVEALAYAERSKARSFLEQLYEATMGVKHGVAQQLLAEETNLYGKLSMIEKHLKTPLNNEQREQLLNERHSLEHDLSILQMKLETSNPRYAGLKYPEPVSVEQVQQDILKEGEVLVEYLQGEEELYVFIVGKTAFYTHILKIGEDFPDKLQEMTNSREAYELYQIIFQPLEQRIAEASSGKDIQHLIIVPDGLLFYLPFEMLLIKDGDTPEYLVDRYTISYSPSASVMKPEILPARESEQYTQDLLALAPFGEGKTEATQVAMRATKNQLLSDTLRSGLEDVKMLPYSAGEVRTISRLYPQSICKIGADATKAFFKDRAKGNRYLHLSTHGYLDHEHAMYSGLLFSDGMLQTYEIFNLDIDAELTVLSACQTGLGELKAGEGLVGLTRAFMYAGSPSVLVSLWSVSDPSTAAFMKRFYRNLNRGMTKAEALRETKIWMKEKSYHTDEHGNVIKHDPPFYWAPFILVGRGNNFDSTMD